MFKFLRASSIIITKAAYPKYLQSHHYSSKYVQDSTEDIIRVGGSRLELQISRWPQAVWFPHVWLRDHCRCPKCYNTLTYQKIHDVFNIPLNIQPLAVKTSVNSLDIKWADGHESSYDYKFLWENNYEARKLVHKSTRLPWTAYSFPPCNQISVPFKDLQHSSTGQKHLISCIIKHGVGFITEVPANVDATRQAVEIVCPVKRTFFGDMWSFSANLEHSDTAYSNEFLGAHTDTTYFSQASRIQVFHCLHAATQGGDTLLVDGFNVAQQFSKLHPEGYKFFSTVPLRSEYRGDDQHHSCLDSVFKHNSVTKELMQFRYNTYDLAPLSSLPISEVQNFYFHLHNLTKIVRNTKNEHWLRLEPGTVILIDNWRIMHGRSAYTGPRIMGGCYLGNEEFTSKARILGIPVE